MIGIAFLIERLGSGGAQRQLLELAKRLDRDVFEPRLVTWLGSPSPEELAPFARTVCTERRWKGDTRVVRTVASWLRSGEVQIAHGWLDSGNLYAAAARGLSRRGSAIASERSSAFASHGPLRRARKRLVHSRVSMNVANSSAGVEMLEKEFGVPEDRLRLIHNGVDLDRFHPVDAAQRASAKHRLGLGERRVLLTVASLSRPKGHLELVEALEKAHLPDDVVSVWVGPSVGDHGELVRARAAHLIAARKVVWLGPMEDTSTVYAAADAAVLPSTREGMPNAILEALACGLPVAATKVGDVPSIVQPGIGWLAEPGDAGSLAQSLHEAIGASVDPEGPRRRVTEIASMEQMVRLHEDLYRSLAAVAGEGR